MPKNKWVQFYTSFAGRATRYDFNVPFALVMLVGYVAAMLLDTTVAHVDPMSGDNGPFSAFWNLLLIWPTLAITTRRLHDINLSGWWQAVIYGGCTGLLLFMFYRFGRTFFTNPEESGLTIIVILLAILIVFLGFLIFLSVKAGTKGPNQYGADPLEVVK